MSMDQDVARMNRSLKKHDLQNIVFGKRDRKVITEQIPINKIVPQKITQKVVERQKPTKTKQVKFNKVADLPDKKEYLEKIQVKGAKQFKKSVEAKEKEQKIRPLPVEVKQEQPIHSSKLRGRPRKPSPSQIKITPPTVVYQQKKQPKNVPKIIQKPIVHQQLIHDGSGRSRRAKLLVASIYNQQDDDEEDDPEPRKTSTKRKRITKKSVRRTNGKEYCLNRIFRKTPKLLLPSFSLQCDLSLLSFPQFRLRMGSFDLLHCSLSASFMATLEHVNWLVQKGFIFMWVERGEIAIGYALMKRWGFDVVDQIIWIRTQAGESSRIATLPEQTELQSENAQLFSNSRSICLVGYKCPPSMKAQYKTKISNNIIFSENKSFPYKPDEIFQIADLMMPGGRKLDLGGRQQHSSWINLEHIEKRLWRCQNCGRITQWLHSDGVSLKGMCGKCAIDSTENKQQYQHQSRIKVLKTETFHPTEQKQCEMCKKSSEIGYILRENEILCLNCFSSTQNSTPSVTILYPLPQYFQSLAKQCSICKSSVLLDIYYECSRCKEHLICRSCIWKSPIDNNHEWKLKSIRNTPGIKQNCFGCKEQLQIPYYACQTCIGWSWCGKCDKGFSQNHPHYQSSPHMEFLLI